MTGRHELWRCASVGKVRIRKEARVVETDTTHNEERHSMNESVALPYIRGSADVNHTKVYRNHRDLRGQRDQQ
jgi:hypothetical protein